LFRDVVLTVLRGAEGTNARAVTTHAASSTVPGEFRKRGSRVVTAESSVGPGESLRWGGSVNELDGSMAGVGCSRYCGVLNLPVRCRWRLGGLVRVFCGRGVRLALTPHGIVRKIL
jgi:hypothetical protein